MINRNILVATGVFNKEKYQKGARDAYVFFTNKRNDVNAKLKEIDIRLTGGYYSRDGGLSYWIGYKDLLEIMK